jgi:hypothetical protein
MENISIGSLVKAKHNRRIRTGYVVGITPNEVVISTPETNLKFIVKPSDVIESVANEQSRNETKPAETQPPKKKKGRSPNGKVSLLDAAAMLLKDTEEALTVNEIIDKVIEKGIWTRTAAKTPNLSLYSAIFREMSIKVEQARFVKVSKGKFGFNTNL